MKTDMDYVIDITQLLLENVHLGLSSSIKLDFFSDLS